MAKKVVKVEKEEVKVTPVKKTIPVVKKKEETKKVEVKPEVKPKPVVKKKAEPKPKVEIKEKPIPAPVVVDLPPENPIPRGVVTPEPEVKQPEVAPEKKLILPGIPQGLTDKLVKIRKALMEDRERQK